MTAPLELICILQCWSIKLLCNSNYKKKKILNIVAFVYVLVHGLCQSLNVMSANDGSHHEMYKEVYF